METSGHSSSFIKDFDTLLKDLTHTQHHSEWFHHPYGRPHDFVVTQRLAPQWTPPYRLFSPIKENPLGLSFFLPSPSFYLCVPLQSQTLKIIKYSQSLFCHLPLTTPSTHRAPGPITPQKQVCTRLFTWSFDKTTQSPKKHMFLFPRLPSVIKLPLYWNTSPLTNMTHSLLSF